MVFLGPKGVLEYTEEDNEKYYDKSKDVFFKILPNIWLFCVLIADSKSSKISNLEYIGISWIYRVGWLWEKEESFFFFIGVEIEGFWDKKGESRRSKKVESFRFDLLISFLIYRAIASEDRIIE